jgi:formylglycine-generating enzyme required for sulfatase activity
VKTRLDAIGDIAVRPKARSVVLAPGATDLPPQLSFELKPGVSLVLRMIPAGTFLMGSPPTEALRGTNEIQREVTISRPFYIGVYETTQMQYHAITEKGNPTSTKPIASQSYRTIQIYLDQLNRTLPQKDAVFRLPTEAEWEYACRAGSSGPFAFGETMDGKQARFNSSLPYGNAPAQSSTPATIEVGTFKPNAWGLYDMHGNVGEFCADWSANYSPGPQTDPLGPEFGQRRIWRGGKYDSSGADLRSAKRWSDGEEAMNGSLGFRIVLGTPLDVLRKSQAAAAPASTGFTVPAVPTLDPTKLPQDLQFSIEIGNPLDLRLIPAGKFTMGSPADEPGRDASEQQHEVTISRPFYIGKYEVKHRQFVGVVGKANFPPSKAGDEGPASGVSYEDALRFCAEANKYYAAQHPLAGYEFRLPTEAEWEYACRAGTTTKTYLGRDLTTADANFDKARQGKTEVGSYAANPWGLFDMYGNAPEWVLDTHAPYGSQPETDPLHVVAGATRIFRGGNDVVKAIDIRSAHRGLVNADGKGGFRVVYGPAIKASP